MSPLGAARAVITSGVADVKGSLILLQTQTASSSLLDFEALEQSTYNVHFFTFTDINVTTQTEFGYRLSDDGGTTYETGYEFANQRGYASGTFAERKSTSQNTARLGGDITTDSNSVFNGYMYLYNAGDSAKYTFSTSHCTFMQGTTYTMEFGSQLYANASTINGIRFGEGVSMGAFTSGTISCYGVRES